MCPNCGSNDHKKVHPTVAIAFTFDRVCKQCGTKYTPHTPRWGAVLCCISGIVGVLMVAFVAIAGAMGMLGDYHWTLAGWIGWIAVAAIFGSWILYGLRCLSEP